MRIGFSVLVAVLGFLEFSALPAHADGKVAVGLDHACRVTDAGRLECFGSNYNGQATVPVEMEDVTYVSTPMFYGTCAIDRRGAHCWGYEKSGSVLTLAGLVNPRQVILGEFEGYEFKPERRYARYHFACALDAEGFKCARLDQAPLNWQLLRKTTAGATLLAPAMDVYSFTDDDLASIEQPCMFEDEVLSCWRIHQLTNWKETRIDLPGAREVALVGSEYFETRTLCRIDDTGEAYCHDHEGNKREFTGLQGRPHSLVGGVNACLVADGIIYCLNKNGSWGETPPWTQKGVRSVDTGWYDLNCADLETDRIQCWGLNDFGQSRIPEADAKGAIQVATGDSHTCLIDRSGEVRCYGSDRFGQSTPPARLRNVTNLVASYHSTCAIADGSPVCWGQGMENLEPPADLGPIRMIDMLGESVCAVTDSGQVRCWGAEGAALEGIFGGLRQAIGVYSTHFGICAMDLVAGVLCHWPEAINSAPVPTDLDPALEAGALDFGGFGACAREKSGSIRCWGGGPNGPPFKDSQGFRDPAELAVGWWFACGTQSDRAAVRCWGSNDQGELEAPSVWQGRIRSLDAGSIHACAIDDWGARCWGSRTQSWGE